MIRFFWEATWGGRGFCAEGGRNHPKWTVWDVVSWKVIPARFGGGYQYLSSYKDAWVVYNRLRIAAAANLHNIPPLLLASVAWAEVGGKPDGVKRPAFLARTFDYNGPDWMDRNWTVTGKPPEQTSFGAVSMQLRVACRELGLNIDNLSLQDKLAVVSCLENDFSNLSLVARHLHSLILHDYPSANTKELTDEQFIVVGARYNRGTERALSDITNSIKQEPGSKGREYSEYGRTMLAHKKHVAELLGNSAL